MTRILTGTANAVNGSTTVTVVGLVLTAINCPVDSPIVLGGAAYYVASLTDTTHVVLTRAYAGSTATVSCEISALTAAEIQTATLNARLATLIANLSATDAYGRGLQYTYIAATGLTDPGPGNLAFDNATLSAATSIVLDNLDAQGHAVGPLLDSFDDSTNPTKALLVIRSIATQAYVAFSLTGAITDQTGFRKSVALTYVGGDGALAAGESVMFWAERVGNKAPDGEPLVIFATGQSNFTQVPTFAWSPPSNLFVWNWDGTTGHVGTAFAAADATKINVSWKFAAEIAARDPNRNVYLITVAIGGQPISHWMTGASSPDVFADIVANVPAALTTIGLSKIDLMLWWQGESDAASPAAYPANFETVIGRFRALSWYPLSTPIVVFGITSTAISGTAANGVMNTVLQKCVAADPDRRMFVYPATFPQSYWDTTSSYLHMTAAGYSLAGAGAARAFLDGVGRKVLPGVYVDAESGRLITSANAAPLPAPLTGTQLHVGGLDAASTRILLDTFGDNTVAPTMVFRHARGTAAAPTALQSGDLLLNVASFGYGATGYAATTRAGFAAYTTQNWTDSAQGTKFEIITTPNGTVTQLPGFRLDNDGSVQLLRIGTTANAANAYIDSAANNSLLRSTSSLEYKTDVEPLDVSYAHALLAAVPIWYRSKASADNPEWSWYGFGAEPVAEIDPRMVTWGYRADDYDLIDVIDTPAVEAVAEVIDNDTGAVISQAVPAQEAGYRQEARLKPDAVKTPQGVAYDRFVVHHHLIIRELLDRVAALEAKLAAGS
jgi:hypothetical protein